MPKQPWEYWGITEEDWIAGWRRTIPAALDALVGKPTDENDKPAPEFEVKIFARRRSDNSVHDYRVAG